MKEKFSLTSHQLKWIAIVIMLIDHVAYTVIELTYFEDSLRYMGVWNYDLQMQNIMLMADRILRGIGRIAFPIFCCMIVEGFQRTSNVNNYLKRLILFALISEIPFDLAFNRTWFDPGYQNVFFTLVLGLIGIMAFSNKDLQILVKGIIMGACVAAGYIFHTDYGCFGVLVILLLYILRKHKWLSYGAAMLVLLAQTLVELPGILGFILFSFYRGEKGKYGSKYGFYIFYPAHLLILYLITAVILPMVYR